jgi:cytochrome c oxidase subunit 2
MNDWFAYNILCLPERAATGAKAIDNLMVYVHYLMVLLFIGWSLYFVYVLWRFNARRNAKADHVGSVSPIPKYTEIAVVAAEAVLLVAFAFPIWAKNVDNFPKPEESTVIQVMAQQFAWNARYPGTDGKFGQQNMKLIADSNVFGVDPADANGKDDIQVFNEMHVPVNKPVLMYLSSKDVIHSFKLVAMRVTQDAIPGLRIPFTFTPTKEGRFQVVCAQLCGNGHAAMAGGFVVVDSPENYAKWLASKAGAGAPASFE